jgi:hypothetical protein
MTIEIGLWIAGVIVSIIIGVFWVSRSIKKSQKNKINIKTGNNSSFSSGDIVGGDKNSDQTNKGQ